MRSLKERLGTAKARLAIRQHRLVLDFTTLIENEMIDQGLNQSDLAERLHKSRAWVSKVFRQMPNLTFFTAMELGDALGMKLKVSRADEKPALDSRIGKWGVALRPEFGNVYQLVQHIVPNSVEQPVETALTAMTIREPTALSA